VKYGEPGARTIQGSVSKASLSGLRGGGTG
jgi:hypothetical protein